jgi:hypothetical protein
MQPFKPSVIISFFGSPVEYNEIAQETPNQTIIQPPNPISFFFLPRSLSQRPFPDRCARL